MEERNEIEEKAPEIFSIYNKPGDKLIDWKGIYDDLSSLNWLSHEGTTESAIISGVWDIIDRWGVSQLEQSQREETFKLGKIKKFITQTTSSLSAKKDRVSMACKNSKSKLDNLLFFKKAKNMLFTNIESEEFPRVVESIDSIFTALKKCFASHFMHMDKFFIMELKHSLNDLLDMQFNLQLVQPIKQKLMSHPDTRKVVYDYEKNYYPIQTSYQYPKARENHFYGELDEHNQRNGYGTMSYGNGDSYEGFWKDDKPHGKGLYIWKHYGSYEGDFFEGTITGYGHRLYASGNVYDGMFSDGKKEGQGVMKFKIGDVYDGEWKQDEMDGAGKYTWRSQDFFVGTFLRDKRHGKGTLTLCTGEEIEGVWKAGTMEDTSNNNL